MSDSKQLNRIHRYLTGECSAGEKKRIENWIEKDPVNRRKFEAFKKIWEVDPRQEVETDLKKAWIQLEEQMYQVEMKRGRGRVQELQHPSGQNKRRSSFAIWLRIAAILVVGILFSVYAISYFTGLQGEEHTIAESESVMQEVKTDRANQSEMTFTDGTVVRLNAASLIRFPRQFDSDVRNLYLEGEAWFDVRHNPDVEFIVETPEATIRVLGTEFNVRAYSDEEQVEVVVADGVVALQSASVVTDEENSEVLLTKGEMSRVKPGYAPTPAQQVDIDSYFSWLQRRFIFDEQPFGRVLREWERRFDVDFNVDNQSLLATPFTGEFRYETFDEMLRLTSITLDFNYSRNNNTITINK
ncbi:MAG: FecR family protein [Balneolaceae bacterium]|nr:FecR family protein [Balneolaceae bacterium]